MHGTSASEARTIDIDIYRRAGTASGETNLRAAARLDIGDWFRFEVGATRSGAAGGVRLPAQSFIGPTLWAASHVDLVGSEIRMMGEPELVPPLARVLIPDVEQHGYRAYPLVDHIADKVAWQDGARYAASPPRTGRAARVATVAQGFRFGGR